MGRQDANTVRCAIYTRKSTDEGLDQDFNSLDAQREAAEAFITSQKHEGWGCLPNRYDDGGFSGGTIDRPALTRLMADIESGLVHCVVVYKVDRLSRSLLDFAKIMEVFDQHGVAFVSVTQQINTSNSMGRLMLNVLLSFAQFEREVISERIRDKVGAQRRKGMWTGGMPVLGYDVDRSGNSPKLVPNTAEARRVRKTFELYLKLGSLLPVVQELDRRGWVNKKWQTQSGTTRGGRKFDRSTLHTLLTNPLYIGKVRHKNEVFDGEHESIVPLELFEKVHEQLKNNGRTGGAEVRNKYGALLKGLLFCSSCGRAMVHTFTGRGRRQYRYYTCGRVIKEGRDACPTGSIPAAEAERVVADQIRCIGNDAQLRAEILRQCQKQIDAKNSELVKERGGLQRELERHHTEIRNLATDGAVSSKTSARIAELHEQIARAEARLTELKSTVVEQPVTSEDIEAAFADFDGLLATLSPHEQRQLVSLLVARVDYDAVEGSVEISFHPSSIRSLVEQQLEEAA